MSAFRDAQILRIQSEFTRQTGLVGKALQTKWDNGTDWWIEVAKGPTDNYHRTWEVSFYDDGNKIAFVEV